jgi:hypothetical protein
MAIRRSTSTVLIPLTLSFWGTAPAPANANCEAFARYGIYDTRSTVADIDRAEAFRTWFCQQNFQSEDEAKSTGASLGYGDLTSKFSLGYSNNQSSWKEFKSSYCNDSSYSSSMRTKTREFVRSINANVTNSMRTCFMRPGLHARIEQGAGADTFNIYTIFNPSGRSVTTARVVNFSVVGGSCTNPLQEGSVIGPEGYDMLCTRLGSSAVNISLNASETLIKDTPLSLPAIVPLPPPEKKEPFDIYADEFVGGQNVAIDECTPGPGILANALPCNARPNFAEFDFDVKVGGAYKLYAWYAAAEPRGVRLSINGTLIRNQALAATTGCWTNDCLKLVSVGKVHLKHNKNVMHLERSDVFPHIRAFRFVPVRE